MIVSSLVRLDPDATITTNYGTKNNIQLDNGSVGLIPADEPAEILEYAFRLRFKIEIYANLKMFFTCFGKMFFMWYGMICPQKGDTSGATAPLSGDNTGGAHANGEGSGSLVG